VPSAVSLQLRCCRQTCSVMKNLKMACLKFRSGYGWNIPVVFGVTLAEGSSIPKKQVYPLSHFGTVYPKIQQIHIFRHLLTLWSNSKVTVILIFRHNNACKICCSDIFSYYVNTSWQGYKMGKPPIFGYPTPSNTAWLSKANSCAKCHVGRISCIVTSKQPNTEIHQ